MVWCILAFCCPLSVVVLSYLLTVKNCCCVRKNYFIYLLIPSRIFHPLTISIDFSHTACTHACPLTAAAAASTASTAATAAAATGASSGAAGSTAAAAAGGAVGGGAAPGAAASAGGGAAGGTVAGATAGGATGGTASGSSAVRVSWRLLCWPRQLSWRCWLRQRSVVG